MHQEKLRQRKSQIEQLLDRKLSIITVVREIVDVLEGEIHDLLKKDKQIAAQMVMALREAPHV